VEQVIGQVLTYLGPGSAITVLGSGLALLAALAVAFFGLVWYPTRRLLRWWRARISRRRMPV
jgi:hypothetical protein